MALCFPELFWSIENGFRVVEFPRYTVPYRVPAQQQDLRGTVDRAAEYTKTLGKCPFESESWHGRVPTLGQCSFLSCKYC